MDENRFLKYKQNPCPCKVSSKLTFPRMTVTMRCECDTRSGSKSRAESEEVKKGLDRETGSIGEMFCMIPGSRVLQYYSETTEPNW